MGDCFRFKLPAGSIVNALDDSVNYVTHIWKERREECLNEIALILQENGYLPKGTTWEIFGDRLYFSTYMPGSNVDLAHYFWEGQVYGPNIPKWDAYEMEVGKNGRPRYVRDSRGYKIGKGDPSSYRTPGGWVKYPKEGQFLEGQGPGSPMGVRHWTEAVDNGGELFDEVVERCGEILRR